MYSQDEVDTLTFEDDHLKEHQLPIELSFSPVDLETEFADEMLELTEKNRKGNVSTQQISSKTSNDKTTIDSTAKPTIPMVLILFCHHNQNPRSSSAHLHPHPNYVSFTSAEGWFSPLRFRPMASKSCPTRMTTKFECGPPRLGTWCLGHSMDKFLSFLPSRFRPDFAPVFHPEAFVEKRRITLRVREKAAMVLDGWGPE